MAKTLRGQWNDFITNLLGWVGLSDNYETAIGADSKTRTKQMMKVASQFQDFLRKYRVEYDEAVKLYNELQGTLPASLSIPASVLNERRNQRKKATENMERASRKYDTAQQLANSAQNEIASRITNDNAGTFKENSTGAISKYDREVSNMVKQFEKELK